MKVAAQRNIRHLSLEELSTFFESIGEKNYRINQVWEWLWQKHAFSFADMTNLSRELRQQLGDHFSFPALVTDEVQYSTDGTVKSRFKTYDGHAVEGVLIPTASRFTACVSSQIGCSLSCKFCATGYMERKRNLTFDEIYDQVVLINQQNVKINGKKLSNIVFMGMGEPLLNYRNVIQAIERITAADGLGMSPKRITVSTAGVAKMIAQLGDDKVKFKLALSLHAPTDRKRNEIMPINETNNLQSLIDALNYFYQKTENEITLEYILFDQFNDSIEDADELIKIFRQIPADLVNIIEYNPIDGAKYRKPSEERTAAFMEYLGKNRVNARLRKSRGKDIDAACGQLANKTGEHGTKDLDVEKVKAAPVHTKEDENEPDHALHQRQVVARSAAYRKPGGSDGEGFKKSAPGKGKGSSYETFKSKKAGKESSGKFRNPGKDGGLPKNDESGKEKPFRKKNASTFSTAGKNNGSAVKPARERKFKDEAKEKTFGKKSNAGFAGAGKKPGGFSKTNASGKFKPAAAGKTAGSKFRK
jgi:23S rRNA (adenine2503-C2)-methyltransferase